MCRFSSGLLVSHLGNYFIICQTEIFVALKVLFYQSVYETSHTDLVCQTLEIVGAYIAWINIALIANMRFVDLLVRFLREQPLRESSADCLHDIVAKGMDPVAKTKLVESLFSVLDSAGILNIDMVLCFLFWIYSINIYINYSYQIGRRRRLFV